MLFNSNVKLIFDTRNVMMTKDEIRKNPYQHGRDMNRQGKAIDYNPFRHTKDDAGAFAEWNKGWQSAENENN